MLYLVVLFVLRPPEEILGLKWTGNMNTFPTSWQISHISNMDLLSLVNDPVDKGSTSKVLKIKHPKGSCSSACGVPGGAGFTVKPFGADFAGNVSTLEFEVFFHATFDFVKGGKLPGIHGGTSSGCSGCNKDLKTRENCFSARLMWGANGNGYPYLYLPLNGNHETEFCKAMNNGKCEGECGWGFNQTSYFSTNKWTKIKQHVKLNTPGRNDGTLRVWLNDVPKINYNKLNYRVKKSVAVFGFSVHPFFGGSGTSWATKVDTYTLYKNFKFADHPF